MRLIVGDLVLKVGRAMIRVNGEGKRRWGQKCIEYLDGIRERKMFGRRANALSSYFSNSTE